MTGPAPGDPGRPGTQTSPLPALRTAAVGARAEGEEPLTLLAVTHRKKAPILRSGILASSIHSRGAAPADSDAKDRDGKARRA